MNINPVSKPQNSQQRSNQGKRHASTQKKIEKNPNTGNSTENDQNQRSDDRPSRSEKAQLIRKLNLALAGNGLRFDSVVDTDTNVVYWLLIEIETGDAVKQLSVPQMTDLLNRVPYDDFSGEDIAGRLLSFTV